MSSNTFTIFQEVLEQSESKIFNLTANKQDKFKPQLISYCLNKVFQELKQGYQPGFTTGFKDLDGLIGGLNKQDLIIIAARASMGKTWLSCHFAWQLSFVCRGEYTQTPLTELYQAALVGLFLSARLLGYPSSHL